MAQVLVPRGVVSSFAKTAGSFSAVYSKPSGSGEATVFVTAAANAKQLSSITANVATASFQSGLLHVNLGGSAAKRSAAGIAEETVLRIEA